MKADQLADQLQETGCVGMLDARPHLPTIAQHVAKGHVVTLTRFGNAEAEICPVGTSETLRLAADVARAAEGAGGLDFYALRSAVKVLVEHAKRSLATGRHYHGKEV